VLAYATSPASFVVHGICTQFLPLHRYRLGGDVTKAVCPDSAEVHVPRSCTVAASVVTVNMLSSAAAGDASDGALPHPAAVPMSPMPAAAHTTRFVRIDPSLGRWSTPSPHDDAADRVTDRDVAP
jgi:hypothetical protein